MTTDDYMALIMLLFLSLLIMSFMFVSWRCYVSDLRYKRKLIERLVDAHITNPEKEVVDNIKKDGVSKN